MPGVIADRQIIFDVSLLAPQSHDFVEGLLEEGNLTFVATIGMLKILRDIQKFKGLLHLWDINPRYAKLIASFVERVNLYEKVKPIALEDLPEHRFWGFLRELIYEKGVTEDILADFLAEEMCLAFAGYPILCTAASPWKIVEFFEKIGARVKRVIHAHMREKAEMLRTKKFGLLVSAMGLNTAFVYVLTGPLGALGVLGSEVITLVIVDG